MVISGSRRRRQVVEREDTLSMHHCLAATFSTLCKRSRAFQSSFSLEILCDCEHNTILSRTGKEFVMMALVCREFFVPPLSRVFLVGFFVQKGSEIEWVTHWRSASIQVDIERIVSVKNASELEEIARLAISVLVVSVEPCSMQKWEEALGIIKKWLFDVLGCHDEKSVSHRFWSRIKVKNSPFCMGLWCRSRKRMNHFFHKCIILAVKREGIFHPFCEFIEPQGLWKIRFITEFHQNIRPYWVFFTVVYVRDIFKTCYCPNG